MSSLFEICEARRDVREGRVAEAEFAADLAQVIRKEAPDDYADPERFFANTHPTRGLRNLLQAVLGRLSGGADYGAVFRLHTNFGGGKTHGLIALVHAARHGRTVERIEEFVEPALVPEGPVRVAAVDGENADPVNGRPLPDGGRAYSLWGEIAWALGERAAFEKVRRSDELHVAPGADTLRELFPDGPVLILVDELGPYLRKLAAVRGGEARNQLSAFLTALCKAVESRPRAALVLTLAIGKEGRATDAYARENEAIFEELEAILARKATILNPTEDDETALILRRRLFERIDEAAAARVIKEYRQRWRQYADRLPAPELFDERLAAFRTGFPFHPELIDTLREKTSSLGKFQRVRGMLRLLAHTTARLWQTRPADACAIHTCHIDLGYEPIRQELTTRLERGDLVPALNGDVAAGPEGEAATAQQIDRRLFAGQPPYGSYVARTVFVHTLAYPDSLAGIERRRLLHAILAPGLDADFIDQAAKAFVAEAAYLDDRPGAPLRFLSEPNLTQIVRRKEREIDPEEVRAELRDRIRETFGGSVFNLVVFPGGPWDVPDDAGGGRPYLVLISHEAETIEALRPRVPELVRRVFRERGQSSDFRDNRNNLLFVVAGGDKVERMQELMRRLLALRALAHSPGFERDLPEYQRQKVRDGITRTSAELAVAIQSAYRHLLYPSNDRLAGEKEDLAHTEIESTRSAERPGAGQRAIAERLRDLGKLQQPEDHPVRPAWVVQRTPLRKGHMTTAGLRAEFRRDPAMPMLVGDDVFLRLLRQGIEEGHWIYQRGDLIVAKGLPAAKLEIDEQSMVMTATYAREHGIWPKPAPAEERRGIGVEPETTPTETAETAESAPPPPAGTLPEGAIEKEGVLKEALQMVFEEARRRAWPAIGRLMLRPFDARDTLTLTGLAATVPNAAKAAQGCIGYQTAKGGVCQVVFEGPLDEFRPVRDFLQGVLRMAEETDTDLRLSFTFEGGLAVEGKPADELVERLTRAGAGAAQVTAIAEAI